MLLPMLHVLKEQFPDRGIDILGERRNQEIFRMALPDMTVLTYDAHPFATLKHLRRTRYAMALDTEQFHHFSGVLAALSRAPLRVGFKINTFRNSLYTHLVNYDLEGKEDRQFGRLLEALCGRALEFPSKTGMLGNAGSVEHQLGNNGSKDAELVLDTPSNHLAMIHIGGSVPEKRWGSVNYAALCERLTKEFGMNCVLVGDHRDAATARDIVQNFKHREHRGHREEFENLNPNPSVSSVVNICGTLSLRQIAELSRTATLFVGPDSGIGHIANAVGAPCVILFGPSDPLEWGPEKGRAVRVNVPCGPCAIFGCNKPCKVYTCMKSITVDAVVDAIRELMKGKQQ